MGNKDRSAADIRLQVIELSADASRRAATGQVVLSKNPIADFLDWLFNANSFECAVLIPRKGFLRRKRAIWPQVVVNAGEAESSRDVLEDAAQSGFELVIGTRSTVEELSNFFNRLGYREDGKGTYGGGDKHDPARAAWNKESFAQAVTVATKLCEHPLCVFAHDGDPIYLLYA